MNPKTFIFIGRSGCGKGTQAELLIQYLKSVSTNPVFYMESGLKFREFISSTGYTANLSKIVMEKGMLQPAFLAVHIWSHLFIEQMDKDKHLFIDGTPRKLEEAKMLEEALLFYGREKAVVIHVDVPREWAVDKLSKRGRADDKKLEEINKRLDWFDKDVVPALEYLKQSPNFIFIRINGEPSIPEVHEEIMAKLKEAKIF